MMSSAQNKAKLQFITKTGYNSRSCSCSCRSRSRALTNLFTIVMHEFNFLNVTIKTPQLIGISLGCLVFTLTIATVLYLLYKSGSFSRLLEEMKDGGSTPPSTGRVRENSSNTSPGSGPELYDYLLAAREVLPLKPNPPLLTLKESPVVVRVFESSNDKALIAEACSGCAQYDGSAYNPALMWSWIMQFDNLSSKTTDIDRSSEVLESLYGSLLGECSSKSNSNSTHVVITDKELSRPIGMVSLMDNSPANLSIRIESVWITPPFQGKKRAHHAIYLLLHWLFVSGYRRVTAELDERHVIGRKFLQRCGFELEAVLRKHRVVGNRNRNTALYVLLNSDWQESSEKKLQSLLRLENSVKKTVRAAAWDVAAEIPDGVLINDEAGGDRNKDRGSGLQSSDGTKPNAQ